MHSLVQDLRFAGRMLRKRAGFTALVVVTLGLGIGAFTTVFSLVDAILVKDLDYERPGELVTIWQTYPGWRDQELLSEAWDKVGLTWDEFRSLRDRSRLFREVAIHRNRTMTLTGAGSPLRLEAEEASPGLFPLLGIRPILGRGFLPGEEGSGAPRLVVLGHGLWADRYGSDPHIVGRSITLDGRPFEVIGVLPREVRLRSTLFNLFRSSIDAGERSLWLPIAFDRPAPNQSRDLEAMGRLAPGVSRPQALAEVDAILRGDRTVAQLGFRLATPRDEIVARHRAPLLLLLAAVALLLLITCANVATLLLGEAVERRGEIATRIALGAGRTRIARQFLTESVILGIGGSLVGVALAPLGVRGFLALGPALPRLEQVNVAQGVLLVAIVTGTICAVLFGLAPALLQHRDPIHSTLAREGGSRSSRTGGFQRHILSVEMALTIVLLITGGLLARSLIRLSRIDPGFDARPVATVRLEIPRSHFADRAATGRFYGQALESVEAIPGVLAAGGIDGLPFPGRASGTGFVVDGRAQEAGGGIVARYHRASAGYFGTMGIPLLAGRVFSDQERQEVVINETMARQGWLDASPLGAGLWEGPNRYVVVGIVGDVRERHLTEDPLPMVYRPALQHGGGDFSLVARTAGDPAGFVRLMQEAVWAVDPDVPVTQTTTVAALVADSTNAERFRVFLITAFAMLATLLASVGVFGVTARSVAQRKREMGIRMALGAQGRGLVCLATLGTLRAGSVGIGLGLLGAMATTRFLAAFLVGTDAWDGWTYASAALLLGSVSAGAAVVAARRVATVEPMQVLKEP